MWKIITAAAILGASMSAHAETAAEFIKADSPKTVRDVGGNTGPSDAMLVGVIDDGSRRGGFAEYVCIATLDFLGRPRVVRVLDVDASARGEWKVLGQAICPKPAGKPVEFN